jgi:hypothetical protein
MTEIKENFRCLQLTLSYPKNTVAELNKDSLSYRLLVITKDKEHNSQQH